MLGSGGGTVVDEDYLFFFLMEKHQGTVCRLRMCKVCFFEQKLMKRPQLRLTQIHTAYPRIQSRNDKAA